MFKIQVRARWIISCIVESSKLSFLIILLMLNYGIFPLKKDRYFFDFFISFPCATLSPWNLGEEVFIKLYMIHNDLQHTYD